MNPTTPQSLMTAQPIEKDRPPSRLRAEQARRKFDKSNRKAKRFLKFIKENHGK